MSRNEVTRDYPREKSICNSPGTRFTIRARKSVESVITARANSPRRQYAYISCSERADPGPDRFSVCRCVADVSKLSPQLIQLHSKSYWYCRRARLRNSQDELYRSAYCRPIYECLHSFRECTRQFSQLRCSSVAELSSSKSCLFEFRRTILINGCACIERYSSRVRLSVISGVVRWYQKSKEENMWEARYFLVSFDRWFDVAKGRLNEFICTCCIEQTDSLFCTRLSILYRNFVLHFK